MNTYCLIYLQQIMAKLTINAVVKRGKLSD